MFKNFCLAFHSLTCAPVEISLTLHFLSTRTLEFLMRHLVRMASYCSETNMHARNLAIVWAPNLLRFANISYMHQNVLSISGEVPWSRTPEPQSALTLLENMHKLFVYIFLKCNY